MASTISLVIMLQIQGDMDLYLLAHSAGLEHISRYGETWLGDSINQSWLDSIYRAYAMVALLNCFLYAYVSTWYSYDNIIGRPEEEEEDIPFLEANEEETAEGDQQNNQEQDVE
ncbi:hypothetical protein SCA6_008008 [Theobroma cacao]